jgi:hypothetical protein
MAVPMNMTLYRLLVKGGANEADAEEAARFDTSALATKADLLELKAATRADLLELKAATKADLAQMQADLQKFIIQAMLGMTAIFAVIVGLFRVFT